jgi:hypothetical protein
MISVTLNAYIESELRWFHVYYLHISYDNTVRKSVDIDQDWFHSTIEHWYFHWMTVPDSRRPVGNNVDIPISTYRCQQPQTQLERNWCCRNKNRINNYIAILPGGFFKGDIRRHRTANWRLNVVWPAHYHQMAGFCFDAFISMGKGILRVICYHPISSLKWASIGRSWFSTKKVTGWFQWLPRFFW